MLIFNIVVFRFVCLLVAVKTQSDLRHVQKLLDAMQQALERGQYEHVGSRQLWNAHCATVDKLQTRLDSLHIAEVCICHLHLSLYNCCCGHTHQTATMNVLILCQASQ